MSATDEVRPIIIKRKIVVSGGGHHGGAWKVAYADFVTAMMAFFLLMWLLGATDDKKRQGLADYFNPTLAITRSAAGGGAGLLEGKAMFAERPLAGTEADGVPPKPTHDDPGPQLGDKSASPDTPAGEHPAQGGDGEVDEEAGDEIGAAAGERAIDGDGAGARDEVGAKGGTEAAVSKISAEEARALAAEQAEQARLEAVGREIAEAMHNVDDGALDRHFLLRTTPEGLVIEIIDADDRPLFASGSAKPAPVLSILMDVLVSVLGETTNDIAVVGHTDSVPFGSAEYSNWELSADRANTARRLMARSGLPEERIARVTGKAAVEPLVADREAPQNRRIAITLLRHSGPNPKR